MSPPDPPKSLPRGLKKPSKARHAEHQKTIETHKENQGFWPPEGVKMDCENGLELKLKLDWLKNALKSAPGGLRDGLKSEKK